MVKIKMETHCCMSRFLVGIMRWWKKYLKKEATRIL